MRSKLWVTLLAFGLILAACAGDDAAPGDPADPTTETTNASGDDHTGDEVSAGAIDHLRINELQAIGSHNSYKLRPEPDVLEALALFSPQLAAEIDYGHAELGRQLDEFGLLQLEIDVYADPDGGRFAERPALDLLGQPTASGEAALDEPGFKVLHTVDIDFETSCLTLVACLEEVVEFSNAEPDHLPVMIMIEAKQVPLDVAAAASGVDIADLPVEWTEVLPFDRDLFDELEAEILSVVDRDRIITPDDVRGDHDTLEAAVLAGDAWPTLGEARGTFLFSLIDTGETRQTYIGDATSLEDRLLFTSSEPGQPDAAFLRVDDPVAEPDRIPELVEAGYLIRTRSDTPGVDAVEGDTTRRDAAFASGAHYISTDYYEEDELLGTGFEVRFPGWRLGEPAVRCNPILQPPGCDDEALRTVGSG
ncbi:MAG: hypothetical protein JJU45_03210 [Acidimicrobiia bacterium]|nr:hypothetical protein [Acidimicrobiia bacterium]